MSITTEAAKAAFAAVPKVADPGTQAAAVIAAGQAKVNSARQWAAATAIGERMIVVGQKYVAADIRALAELQTTALEPFRAGAADALANALLGANTEFEALMSQVAAAFPQPAPPYGLTTVDAITLDTKIKLFLNAGPDEGSEMVSDAVAMDDRPFLAAVAILLGDAGARNTAWQALPGGTAKTNAMLAQIDAATLSVESAAADAAAEMTDDFRSSWRYLCSALLDANGRIDSVQRQVGALAPLLQPLATVRVGFDPATEVTA